MKTVTFKLTTTDDVTIYANVIATGFGSDSYWMYKKGETIYVKKDLIEWI